MLIPLLKLCFQFFEVLCPIFCFVSLLMFRLQMNKSLTVFPGEPLLLTSFKEFLHLSSQLNSTSCVPLRSAQSRDVDALSPLLPSRPRRSETPILGRLLLCADRGSPPRTLLSSQHPDPVRLTTTCHPLAAFLLIDQIDHAAVRGPGRCHVSSGDNGT